MPAVRRRSRYTEDDYFAIERISPHKHELVAGEILAMAGGRPRHNYLAGRAVVALGTRLVSGPCVALSSDQRIALPENGYTYADASVFCGIDRGREETGLNPVVLVEVLSPSTRGYDRGEKLDRYKEIASLRHILLIEPDEAVVEHWHRTGSRWELEVLSPPEGVARLSAIGVDVPIAEIYQGFERVPA
jgi:Uma2 family endonuclease